MKIRSAEFVTSAVDSTRYPSDNMPELALVGKSNVGKSSLINALVKRKRLAKTSSTPGKTRTINFYLINRAFYLVDLPGYGYAKTPSSVRRAWRPMIEGYFRARKNLCGVLVILDVRRDVGDTERALYEWLKTLEIPVVTVLTKCDKLSANKLFKHVADIKKQLPVDEPLPFSALKGTGREELLKRIEALVRG